jgi:hypothetical protein
MTAVETREELCRQSSALERPVRSRRPSERKALRAKSDQIAQIDEVERTFSDRWEW